jgi:hypothetical protein
MYRDARVAHIRNGGVQSSWPRFPVILLGAALFLTYSPYVPKELFSEIRADEGVL